MQLVNVGTCAAGRVVSVVLTVTVFVFSAVVSAGGHHSAG
jgi:hypothetical protein